MRTSVYKLYASVSVDTNAAATVEIRRDGVIFLLSENFHLQSASGTAWAVVEVSAANVIQDTVNDINNVLDEVRLSFLFTTSGGANPHVNKAVECMMPVRAGDRIYLNANVNGTVTVAGSVFIHVRES